MLRDKFTEISAERFRSIEPGYSGHAVIYFAYTSYDREQSTFTMGLWLSRQLVKRQIEAAHYIPDRECADTLRRCSTAVSNQYIWLGLPVSSDNESIPTVKMPQFMVNDYERLALDRTMTAQQELEERFCVQILAAQ